MSTARKRLDEIETTLNEIERDRAAAETMARHVDRGQSAALVAMDDYVYSLVGCVAEQSRALRLLKPEILADGDGEVCVAYLNMIDRAALLRDQLKAIAGAWSHYICAARLAVQEQRKGLRA